MLLIMVVMTTSACDVKKTSACSFSDSDQINICTTLFPQYDFAKQIGGDLVDVKLLLKPGVDSHSYEPTANDIFNINKADLFIYTNEEMEPWVVNKLVNSINQDQVKLVDVSQNITMLESTGDEHEEEEEEHEDEDEHLHDPHVWTSPSNAIIMLETVLAELILLAPEHAETFTSNADAYKAKLLELDEDFTELFENSSNDTIIHGGHFSFGYFAHEYDLHFESPYEGFSPNQQLTSENIIAIIEAVQEHNQNVIYFEEFQDVQSARTIQNELKERNIEVELKLLHGIHNVTKDELASGATYVSLMRQNYENLKVGFDVE